VREHYLDFGPTLAAEKLAEDHGVTVSRETLRKWMAEAGIWLPRKHRRTFHQPRLRRDFEPTTLTPLATFPVTSTGFHDPGHVTSRRKSVGLFRRCRVKTSGRI